MSKTPRSYALFDHTADVGIEITDSSLEGLYETAAHALFDLMVETVGGEHPPLDVSEEVRVEAADREELLVRWLAELLYLYDTRRVVLSRFQVISLTSRALEARVEGTSLSPRYHRTRSEIKAVTYHQVSVTRSEETWKGRVVLDV